MPDVFDEFAARVVAANEAAAEQMQQEARDLLDVPYPGPSVPGESPHRRTGRLQAGVTAAVAADGDLVTIQFASEAPYSSRLQFGMDRPFMSVVDEKWSTELPQFLRQQLGI